MGRVAFHLSLRDDDPFELKMAEVIRAMRDTRGSAKQFLVNILKLVFDPEASHEDLLTLAYKIARDSRPVCLMVMPELNGPGARRLQPAEQGLGLLRVTTTERVLAGAERSATSAPPAAAPVQQPLALPRRRVGEFMTRYEAPAPTA